MEVTSKGQVTIPLENRRRLGLLPHTSVEFERAGDHAHVRKARSRPDASDRGQMALAALSGSAYARLSTEQIMALIRGETRRAKRRK